MSETTLASSAWPSRVRMGVQRARATFSACGAFGTLSLLAVLGACDKKAPDQSDGVRPVQAVTVTLGADAQEITYTGDVRARWETALGFRVPGKIVARYVEVAQRVKTGQTLARLDPEDQKLSAEAAKQQLLAARSDFQQAKSDLVRYKELVNKGIISA